jgi:hypothetical protein
MAEPAVEEGVENSTIFGGATDRFHLMAARSRATSVARSSKELSTTASANDGNGHARRPSPSLQDSASPDLGPSTAPSQRPRTAPTASTSHLSPPTLTIIEATPTPSPIRQLQERAGLDVDDPPLSPKVEGKRKASDPDSVDSQGRPVHRRRNSGAHPDIFFYTWLIRSHRFSA